MPAPPAAGPGTVADVLEYLASGMSQDDILADFPDLQPAHIQAVLRYAAEREKRLSELTGSLGCRQQLANVPQLEVVRPE